MKTNSLADKIDKIDWLCDCGRKDCVRKVELQKFIAQEIDAAKVEAYRKGFIDGQLTILNH